MSWRDWIFGHIRKYMARTCVWCMLEHDERCVFSFMNCSTVVMWYRPNIYKRFVGHSWSIFCSYPLLYLLRVWCHSYAFTGRWITWMRQPWTIENQISRIFSQKECEGLSGTIIGKRETCRERGYSILVQAEFGSVWVSRILVWGFALSRERLSRINRLKARKAQVLTILESKYQWSTDAALKTLSAITAGAALYSAWMCNCEFHSNCVPWTRSRLTRALYRLSSGNIVVRALQYL